MDNFETVSRYTQRLENASALQEADIVRMSQVLEEFHTNGIYSAAAKLLEYVQEIQCQMDKYFQEDEDDFLVDPRLQKLPKIQNTKKPSHDRVMAFCYLFLHIPAIQNEYNRIHSDKMVSAFNIFRTKVKAIRFIPVENKYETLQREMEASMMEVTDKITNPVELLSKVSAYAKSGIDIPDHLLRFRFAYTGIPTFFFLLQKYIEESTKTGEDITQVLIKGFAMPRGLAFKAMRLSPMVTRKVLNHHSPGNLTLESIKTQLNEMETQPGICPAIFPIEDPGTGEVRTQRPIALEYALVIARKIMEQEG